MYVGVQDIEPLVGGSEGSGTPLILGRGPFAQMRVLCPSLSTFKFKVVHLRFEWKCSPGTGLRLGRRSAKPERTFNLLRVNENRGPPATELEESSARVNFAQRGPDQEDTPVTWKIDVNVYKHTAKGVRVRV